MATRAPSKRLFLGASLQSRDGTLTKDALVTNGFLEKKGDNVRTFKRGGLNLVVALGAGLGQGMVNFLNSDGLEVLYAAQNGTLYYANTPSITGVWTQPAYPAGTHGQMCSFNGNVWLVIDTTSYYKNLITDAAWTTGATGLFGAVAKNQGTLVSFNNLMWLIGPSTASAGAGSKQVWNSPDGITWTSLGTPLPLTQITPRILVFGGKMWYIGGSGYGADANTNNIYSSIDGITWTLVTAAPAWATTGGATYRKEFSACVFGGKMWIAGGKLSTGTVKNDVFYSSDGATWTQATAAGAFSIRVRAGMAGLGPYMVIAGGGDNSSGNPRLDAYSSVDGITWTLLSATIPSYFAATTVSDEMISHEGVPIIQSEVGPVYPPAGSAGGVSTGTLTIGANDLVDFAKNRDGTQIMARTNYAGAKLNTSTQALVTISNVNYPSQTVRGCVYLDGVFYVMKPDGTICGSDDEDCTSWNANNTIVAEFEPDAGVCLGKYNNYVVAFGQWTTQMFWDAANPPPGSALSPVQNGVLLIGCAHANSVAQIESTLLWIAQRKGQGSSFQKGRFIAMLEGQSYVQISTPDVDRVLDADDLATVYSCVGSFAGHNFYLLGLGTTGASLVYDLTEKFWYVWTRYATGSNKTISALTQVAGIATATSTSHGFSDGDPITISGATQSGYNLTQVNITYVDANTFTYPVASGTVSPATGSPVATPYSESYLSVCASCNFQGQQVFQDVSGGNIFSMLDSIFRDNALPINMKVRTSNQDLGTNKRKFAGRVIPNCDMPSSSQTALVRYTDNDYQTYSTYRRVDISDVSPSMERFGTYRRRAWEWRYTGNTRHRIESLEIDQEMEA